jgi:uroporphyrinogen decarboxylase
MAHRYAGLARPFQPDADALVDNILRKGTPRRVHHIELFHDREIQEAIARRFDLLRGAPDDDEHYSLRLRLAVNLFCGFDKVSAHLVDLPMPMRRLPVEDTAELAHAGGRVYVDEHRGPITTWDEFHAYPWPDPARPSAARQVEWLCDHAPDGMCLIGHTGHFCEFLCWLMGYESLCYALHDQRDLVEALADRILQHHTAELKRYLEYDRVRIIWGSDDMGFKTGLMFSADDMRRFVLRGHRALAKMAHEAGRPYILHSCGNLAEIIDDLTDDVKIDGKHSFEDTIEDVRRVKGTYGRKTALLGGIDVDFLCRADEPAIRRRVRETLDTCLPGGGYCLGSGNSVANYIPLDNYLAMIDEGRLYAD